MLRFLAISIAVLGLVALPQPGAAQSGGTALGRLVSSGTLRVGMSGSQPPLNFRSREGKLMGLEVDLAVALSGLMGLELEIVEKSFGDLLGALSAGDVDLIISGMTITPERSLRASFVGPYFLSGKSILTRSSRLAQINDASDLDQAELTLAALAGSTSESFVKTRLPKAGLVATEDYDAAVKMLMAEKVDAVVADREIVALTAFRNSEAGLATLRDPLTIEPIGIAAPSGDAQLLNLLENSLDALEASGVLNGIRVRWLERNDWLSQLP